MKMYPLKYPSLTFDFQQKREYFSVGNKAFTITSNIN